MVTGARLTDVIEAHDGCISQYRLKIGLVFVEGRREWEHVPIEHSTYVIRVGCLAGWREFISRPSPRGEKGD